jgi:hypothetical protein
MPKQMLEACILRGKKEKSAKQRDLAAGEPKLEAFALNDYRDCPSLVWIGGSTQGGSPVLRTSKEGALTALFWLV